jgi:hypothetical protein
VNKQGLILDKVVLLGRTLDEYVRFFALDPAALRGQAVLDVASGVSSFCAEANAQGIHVTAFDLIYELPPEQIAARCGPDLDHVTKAIGGLQAYKWEFYKNPETMRTYRERAYNTFLADYRAHFASGHTHLTPSLPRSGGEGRGEEAPSQRPPADELTNPSPQPSPRAALRGEGVVVGASGTLHGDRRYISGSLPRLPFRDGQFDLTLSSYLMFVYEDKLDYEFHKQSVLEILRVTKGEARFYPLVSFEAKRCSHLDPLKHDPDLRHLTFEEVQTDFEFLVGSNWFLRVRHRHAL